MTEAPTAAQIAGPYDKTGREIRIGDVVKIDHYIHPARRRRCFMFKHVVDKHTWPNGHAALRLSHLDMTERDYFEACHEGRLAHYEIVQGAHDDFYDRPRVITGANPHVQ